MAQNDVPLWVDDGSLGWSPMREPAAEPAAPPAGPWSPPITRASAEAEESSVPLWPWRLGIGLMQGLLFYVLFRSRADGVWPGNDGFLFDAIALPLLFLPWSVMAGLGRIALPRLVAFAAIATVILAALGWYHRWRILGVEIGQPGLSMLVLAGAALFVAQSFLEAWPKSADGGRFAHAEFFAAGWALAARLLVLLPAMGLGLMLVHLLPGLTLERGDILAMPLLGLVGALALQVTARFTAALGQGAVATATALLPLAVAAAVILLCADLAGKQLPLVALLALMGGLVLAIGASWRDGAERPLWREGFEIVGALLLPLLAGLSVWMLAQRVTALGWTSPRLFAAAALGLLCAYGAAYSLAAVIALGRGHGLKGLGVINIALAAVALIGLLALASPLADPLRLAPQTQAARLERGRVAVAHFDFANLPRDGARFGAETLAALSRSLYPDIARAAQTVRGTPSQPPNPTEIGANIAVRTPGARLPATLLARDWSQVAGAPPCLTAASQNCEAFFLDLNNDHRPEILLVTGSETRWWAAVMEEDAAGRWRLAGRLTSGCGASLSDLRAGRLSVLAALPGWDDLQVAGARLSVTPSGTGCSHY